MWQVIDTGYDTPSMNMAIDEVLLERDTPVLRFYRWKPAALSLGFFQKTEDIDIGECKKQGVGIVRRITGGKTVLHDKELTYSFVCSGDLLPEGIIESYQVISKGIVLALNKLGIKAELKNNPRKPSSAICFNEPSWYEIVADNKKIVGSAQKRVNGKVLQHGSVLLDVDYDVLGSLFKIKPKKEELKKRITAINQKTNKKTYSDVADAMVRGFSANFNVKFEESELTGEEIEKAKEVENKYALH